MVILLFQQMPEPVDSFYEDLVRPTLLSFDLNMNNGMLSLTFDETVNGSSLMSSEILLLESPSNESSFQLMLSGPSFVTSNFTTVISIPITDSDLNEIKRQRGLATDRSNTYISFGESLITDMNFNSILPRNDTSALQVSNFTSDTTPPELLRFDLNLTSELLVLTFSETVRVETLGISHIVIQNAFASGPEFYRMLSGGEVLSNDSTVVVIRLNTDDLNEIKIRTEVATSENDSYISFINMLIQDMNGNQNMPISTINPQQVSSFAEDEIEPLLESYALDMDGDGSLTLFFSESVNVSSLDVTQITLLMAPDNLDLSHTLEAMSYSNSSDGPVVEIALSLEDLNESSKFHSLLCP